MTKDKPSGDLTNLLADVPIDLPDEIFQTLLETDAVRIERIISLGHTSGDGHWLEQDRGEWVLVLQGAAHLVLEGESAHELLPGDFFNIPAHRKHRVIWTAPDEPTIWLAIHYC